MITMKNLDAVQEEMRRLEKTITDLRVALLKEEGNSPSDPFFWRFPRHTGAVRRASMDLSRALVQLRKSGH